MRVLVLGVLAPLAVLPVQPGVLERLPGRLDHAQRLHRQRDHHEVQLTDHDGESVIARKSWDRGREYAAFFQAQKLGTYQLNCGTHVPSMTATILMLPRER